MSARHVAGYRLGPVLGRGAVASVFAVADDPRLAVKLLDPARAARQPLSRQRFLREARAAARLDHPRVVRVVEHGETPDGTPFLVMERVHGETLASRLARGPLAIVVATAIGAQIAEALAHAHDRGVIHRDVKPANVLLAQSNEARLADFGLARDRLDLPLTATGALCGTPAYMAPELVDGVPASPASDVYALGCVLFEMLTGRWPYTGSTPRVLRAHAFEPAVPPSTHRPAVPPALDALVLELLAKAPEARTSPAATAARLGGLRHPQRRDDTLDGWRARVAASRARVAELGAAVPGPVAGALATLERRLAELETVGPGRATAVEAVLVADAAHKVAQLALAERKLARLLGDP